MRGDRIPGGHVDPPSRARLALGCLALVAAGCQAGAGEPFEVVWGGDILLGDAAQPHLDEHGYAWPFEHLTDELRADYLIGNGEGPITEREEPFFPDAEFDYNARPEAAAGLAAAGFDAIGLSNNHILDRGPEGMADTRRHLEEAGIRPFGAGLLGEAEEPLIVSTPSGSVAVLAFGSAWQAGEVATARVVGTIPLADETIQRGHRMATDADASWVVAYVHWGTNYAPIDDDQRRFASSFAAAGYDLVIGHHPHVVQEIEVIDGMPVLYSVGNLAFGTPGRFTPDAPGLGLIVRTRFGEADGPEITLRCIVTDNEIVEFQPEPCSIAEARQVFSHLGPSVQILDDGTASVVTGG